MHRMRLDCRQNECESATLLHTAFVASLTLDQFVARDSSHFIQIGNSAEKKLLYNAFIFEFNALFSCSGFSFGTWTTIH